MTGTVGESWTAELLLECHHLHHPVTARSNRSGGRVGARRGNNPILGNIRVGCGNDAGCKTCARTGCSGGDGVGREDEFIGRSGGGDTAVGRSAAAGGGG